MWKQVLGGYHNSLAIDADGNLWSWGYNYYGQIGDGTTENRTSPIQIKKRTKFTNVSLAQGYSLAIDTDGNLWSWGNNYYGQLGDGTTENKTSPIQIKEGTKFASVSVADNYSIAIDIDGNLWGWGYNYYGQIGDGTTENKRLPIQIKEETRFRSVSVGNTHFLAIDIDGNLWSSGKNNYGQLGDGTTENKTLPVHIKEGTKFASVAVADNYSIAIDIHGNLWGWGYNANGQIGDGTTENKTSPIQIKEGTKFASVAVADNYSIAIDIDGNLWGWGNNYYGQIGDGTTENKTLPVHIKEGTKFISVSVANSYSFGIDKDGNLWGWGKNYSGQIGDGTIENKTSPIQIKKGTKFTSVSIGYDYSLAIDADGNLWSWGSNYYGQLGNGETERTTYTTELGFITDLSVLPNFVDVEISNSHIMVLDENGDIWTAGNNKYGELGDNVPNQRDKLKKLNSDINYTNVYACENFSLAIDENKKLWAWGKNNYGQLGNGTTIDSSIPTHVMDNINLISCGKDHSLAIDGNNKLWAWGLNVSGQLGNNTTIDSAIPIEITSEKNYISISSRDNNSVAIDSDGVPWVWGLNVNKQSPVELSKESEYNFPEEYVADSVSLDGNEQYHFITSSNSLYSYKIPSISFSGPSSFGIENTYYSYTDPLNKNDYIAIKGNYFMDRDKKIYTYMENSFDLCIGPLNTYCYEIFQMYEGQSFIDFATNLSSNVYIHNNKIYYEYETNYNIFRGNKSIETSTAHVFSTLDNISINGTQIYSTNINPMDVIDYLRVINGGISLDENDENKIILTDGRNDIIEYNINYLYLKDLPVEIDSFKQLLIEKSENSNVDISNVTWVSSNEEVATIDRSTGLLNTLTLGETTITATDENGRFVISSTITVVPKIILPFPTDDVLGEAIINENKNINDFVDDIDIEDSVVTIIDRNGDDITNGIIGTGMNITINVNGVIKNYKVIVKGDVTGDGRVNIADISKIYQHLRKTNIMTDQYYLKAGKVTEGDSIHLNDVIKTYRYFKKLLKEL